MSDRGGMGQVGALGAGGAMAFPRLSDVDGPPSDARVVAREVDAALDRMQERIEALRLAFSAMRSGTPPGEGGSDDRPPRAA